MEELKILLKRLKKEEVQFVENQLKQQKTTKTKSYLQLWNTLKTSSPKPKNKVAEKELYWWLLDTLESYHRECSKTEQVKKQLHLIHILTEKSLLDQAKKLLKKVSEQIYTYELLEQLPEYITLKKQLLLAQKNTNLSSTQAVYIELQEGMEVLKNINENWWLKSQMAHWHHQKITKNTSLNNEVLPIEKERVYSLRAQLENLKAWALFHFINQNTKGAYQCNQELLTLFDQYPQLVERYPQQYLTTFYNYLVDSQLLGTYDVLENGIQTLRTLPKNKLFKAVPNLELKVFELGYMLELNIVVAQKQFVKGLAIVSTLQKELKYYKNKLAKHSFLTFHYLMAYIYFANQAYEETLTTLNKIRQTPHRNIVEELMFFADWLYMLAHLELGNYLLLESLLAAHKRVKQKLLRFPQLQAILFKLCKQHFQPATQKEQKTYWQMAKNQLQKLKKSSPERRAWQYFDYDRWLAAKFYLNG